MTRGNHVEAPLRDRPERYIRSHYYYYYYYYDSNQVQSGELQFEFEGETLHAKTDSFMKAQVVEATPVPPKEMNDKVMLIAIGIFLGVVALVVVIAIISVSHQDPIS